MKLDRSCKIALVALLAAQSFWAAAQTNTAATPVDYSAFSTFIANRNIFDPNRVPNVVWTPRTNRPVVYVAPPPPASFSLVGIIGYGDGKLAGAYAFFDGTRPQYRKTVQLNGDIATFKVADIAADSVTLLTGTNSRTVLKIGEQLHDDGSGHWLNANGNDVRYNNNANGRFGNRNGYGNGNRRQRNNNFGGFNNNGGGFNRNRNNYGGATETSDNSQAQDPNMGAQDNNTPTDMAPSDDNMPPSDDNSPPDPGQQNN